jgi:hypothetical protein
VLVPHARSLLETVRRTVQLTNVLGASRVNEAGGLVTVDDLGELTVEECILDVNLASLPLKGERDGEDGLDRCWFYNRTERLIEVNALLLRETIKHPACFVAVEGAIGLQLVLKDPLAETMLVFRGGGTRSQVSLPRRASYSAVIISSQLGSLTVVGAEDGAGEYLLTEACMLSHSQEGTCMSELLRVRCTSGRTGDGACTDEGGGDSADKGVGEGGGKGRGVQAQSGG